MKRVVPAVLCLAVGLTAQADVVEFQNGAKAECRVLSLFNQRLECADKDGSITGVNIQQVKQIDFDAATVTITTREHTILNGQLLALKDGAFTVAGGNGMEQRVAAVEVTDLTVSRKNTDAASQPRSERDKPSPPPPRLKPTPASRPKPAPVRASSSRPPAKGSIQPERGKITIVDFYADWCGPCRRIGPVLEKIAEDNSDIVLKKVNIDKHRDLAREYNVTAIPRIVIYDKEGGEVDTVIGPSEFSVRQAIEEAGGGSRSR